MQISQFLILYLPKQRTDYLNCCIFYLLPLIVVSVPGVSRCVSLCKETVFFTILPKSLGFAAVIPKHGPFSISLSIFKTTFVLLNFFFRPIYTTYPFHTIEGP